MITTTNGGKEIDQLTIDVLFFIILKTFVRVMNVNERVGHGLTHSNDKTGFFLQRDCVTHPSKHVIDSNEKYSCNPNMTFPFPMSSADQNKS
jgi:hypothetical protein